MMYSDIGRLNCNVSYTSFATPIRGQVHESFDPYTLKLCSYVSPSTVIFCINLMLLVCQASDSKDLSSMLHKALEGAIILESFPKTTVDVFALVLESGGSEFLILVVFFDELLAIHLVMMD